MSIVLDQQSRNGSFESGSVSVPPDLASVQVSGTMSEADAKDAANACKITIQASWDDGQTYNTFLVYDWVGGIGPRGNFSFPSVSAAVPIDENSVRANRIRVSLDTLGHTLNTGLDVSFA